MPYKDREKQRKYQREWKAKRRAEYMDGRVCEWCGGPGPLQLHHKEPENKVDHRIWSWSKERLEAELKKCMRLCYDCHQAIHSAFLDEDAKKLPVKLSETFVESEV